MWRNDTVSKGGLAVESGGALGLALRPWWSQVGFHGHAAQGIYGSQCLWWDQSLSLGQIARITTILLKTR